MRFNPLTEKDGTWTFYNKAHVAIMYARIQFFLPFLLDFMSGSRILLHKEFWVNVSVAMIFGMVVYSNCCMK